MLGWTLRQNTKADDRRGLPVYASGAAQAALWGEISSPELYATQAERYSRSDLIYICVNRLAALAAMQSHRLTVFDAQSARDPETGIPTEQMDDHPFLELWRRPNVWDSSYEFLEAATISDNLNGNIYWHVDDGQEPERRSDGSTWTTLEEPPVNLWHMRPDRVSVRPDPEKYIGHYLYEAGGKKFYYDPQAIIHHKRHHPLRDFEGMSPVEPANYAAVTDVAAQKSNWSLYRNAMRLSMIVESDRDHVDPDEVALMEKYLLERYTGSPDKAHQVAFLWAQFKAREMGMTMRDAEFIEGAKLSRTRIFGVYGVHPGIVLSEDVNRANAQIGEYVTLKFTVAPFLARLASEITPVLAAWPDTPPAEAHFVGVIPQDREMEAKVAEIKAIAAERLIRSLGPEEGVAEAQRQGLLSADIQIGRVFPVTSGLLSADGRGRKEGETDALVASLFRNYP